MNLNRSRRASSTSLWLAPAVLWTTALSLVPTLFVLIHAFLAPRFDAALGRSRLRWVGLENFRRFFTDDQLVHSVFWTVAIALAAVVLEVVLGLVLALLAWQTTGRFGRLARGTLLAPMFMAPVAVAYLATTVFAQDVGLLNGLAVRLAGADPEALIAWRSDPFWASIAVLCVEVWQWTPFCFAVLLAALATQPEELYEAAVIDGAGSAATLRHVTLPLLRPALLSVTLLRLVESLKIFDVPYGLTRGGPGTATQSYSMWIKEIGLTRYDMGLASAMGLMLLVVLAATGTVAAFVVRRMAGSERSGKR